MKAYYTIEVRDRDGKLLKRIKRRSHSYVRQWNDLIATHVRYTAGTIKDTGGTNRTILTGVDDLRADAAATDDTRGIVVGTGSTAVTISDYALATKVAHGTGSGQMYYYAMASTAPAVAGSTCSFTITRVIGNQSGATITLAEIGLYVWGMYTTSYYLFMVIRDVITSIDVPDGGAITVVYTLEATV